MFLILQRIEQLLDLIHYNHTVTSEEMGGGFSREISEDDSPHACTIMVNANKKTSLLIDEFILNIKLYKYTKSIKQKNSLFSNPFS